MRSAEPGTTWAYNSFHLQVAAAMAAKAANLTVQGLLHTYLIDKLGLSGTSFVGGENPYIAAAMQTTPDDYDKILLAYTSYTLLPKEVRALPHTSLVFSVSHTLCNNESGGGGTW